MTDIPGLALSRTPRQTLTVRCEICAKDFTAARRSRRYCSKKCKTRAQALARPARVCDHCSASFHSAEADARFCSFACARYGVARATAQQRGNKLRGSGDGRTYIKRDGRHEHRIVAETHFGRPIAADEVVHHINGDPRDNRPENLQILPRAVHSALHTRERWAHQRAETS